MKIEAQDETKSLLDQMRAMEEAKAERIRALLKERVDRTETHEKRLVEIAQELKDLGWHRTRTAKNAAKPDQNGKAIE
jgi:hypothetical protein